LFQFKKNWNFIYLLIWIIINTIFCIYLTHQV
jgi:hypothetical protein